MLVSYVPEPKKIVILVSTLHVDKKIDPDSGEQQKPSIITFYNATKGGVDTADNSVFGKSRWSAVKTETAAWEARKYMSVTSSSVVSKHVPESTPCKKTCKLCKGMHLLSECQEFKKMRHYKRLEFVKKENLCFKCLCSGHVAGDCSVEGCVNPKHHTLLHKNIPQTVATATIQTKIENSLPIRRQNSLPCLPILPVKVRDGLLSFTTCALLDSGSQQTFCTNDLAKRLGVQG